ncbi:MAG: type I restriction endonuclease subunit R [Clostridia bacterium]|nr:type I restriction endonuclease subunit R [Clostridia bacterium]
MYNFTEAELEQATMDWFEELGYDLVFAPEISPEGEYPEREDYSDVMLDERLRDALYRINRGIPREGIEEAFRKIKIPQSPSLIINNKEFQKMITDGIDVTFKKDGDFVTKKVYLFDFEDEHNNDWMVCNQFTVIENRIEKRPDLIVFVNGLPLVVIELKSSSNEDVGISEGYNQLQTYKGTVPSLFTYNAFMVTSDGINARAGTLTSGEDRFMMWRTIDGVDVAPQSIPQLEVLIKGMFKKRIFLDIVKHFILFQTDGNDTFKILAGYHQYHAVNKAFRSTKRATDELGDRRIGVIWHTQGSGKSLSMVFYAGKLVLGMDNPTIVVITDRNDLDNQLYSTFSKSKDLLRQEPVQAESRSHLRELLSVRDSGGIIFTTIHKFAPEEKGDSAPVLTDRKNVIVIADEAHRSQYGFNADVVEGKEEANVKYGYAKYMRDALPHASYIGFTGTPVELSDKNTPAVFGDYIDIYDMTRAVEDGTTVKIFYESRIAKLDLPEEMKPLVDAEYEEITEYQEQEQKEKLKSKWSRLEAIVGSERRVELIAQDIVDHFEERQKASFGKSMIVAMSRRICVDLYDTIVKLRPDWHSQDDDKGAIKVVISGSSSDDAKLQPHIGNKKRREFLAKRMKDNDDELKIVIVRDMWLTGFDVPSMSTMYIDKPMKGHNLMQAIARVNRVFKDKPGGLVVDYIGIVDSLKRALTQYTESDRKNTGIDTDVAVGLMLEKYDVIRDMLHGYDYSKFFTGKASNRMQAIVETIDFILGEEESVKKDFLKYTTELSKAYSLCATTDEAQKLNIEIGFFKAVKSGIIKMIPDDQKKKTSSQLDAQINQLISKSIISEEVIDILGEVGLQKPNIAILSDEFLEEVKGLKHKNLAVELLNRLLKGKVKAISRRNLIQSKKFSEMLENTLLKYQNRAIETTQVILELIELAKEMNEAHKRGEDTGLNDDEIAFYDALADNDTAKDVLGDDILKQIAIDLTDSIKRNMSIDWNLRDTVRAKMRMTIRRLLKKYGYPPDQQPKAIEIVMKQAELMCTNEVVYCVRETNSYEEKVAEEQEKY